MSFILNNIKYFYVKYLALGWNSTVHLIKDINNNYYVAKISNEYLDEMIDDIITSNPKYNRLILV